MKFFERFFSSQKEARPEVDPKEELIRMFEELNKINPREYSFNLDMAESFLPQKGLIAQLLEAEKKADNLRYWLKQEKHPKDAEDLAETEKEIEELRSVIFGSQEKKAA